MVVSQPDLEVVVEEALELDTREQDTAPSFDSSHTADHAQLNKPQPKIPWSARLGVRRKSTYSLPAGHIWIITILVVLTIVIGAALGAFSRALSEKNSAGDR